MKSSSSSSTSNKKHFVPPLPSNSNVTISSTRKITNPRMNDQQSFSSNDGLISSSVEPKIKQRVGNHDTLTKREDEKISYQQTGEEHNESSTLTSLLTGTDNNEKISDQYQPPNSTTTGDYCWPLPFDDNLAISNNKLEALPKTHQLIQSHINETKSIQIRVITWNQQAKQLFKPSPTQSSLASLTTPPNPLETIDENLTKKLFSLELEEKRYHIIAIGTQECENSISKSILNPLKEKWERYCKEALGDDYQYIRGHALQASHLVIFVHKAIEHLISNVQSYAVPTGICNTLGNKGGVGIKLNVGKTSFCFLTAHLAAHQDQIDRRTYEFTTISSEIANNLGRNSSQNNASESNGANDALNASSPTISTETISQNTGASIRSSKLSVDEEYQPLTENDSEDSVESDHSNRKQTCCSKSPCSISRCCDDKRKLNRNNPLLEEFDHVIWGGDLNYRINGTRDVVDSLLADHRHDVLLSNDQLRLLLQFEKTFVGFVEGPISFRPTYKYDKGKDVYDTSAKKRIPSWTDRILYKTTADLELLSYFCNQEVRDSDHRPVYASFKCKIEVDPTNLHSSAEKIVRSESRSEVCVIS